MRPERAGAAVGHQVDPHHTLGVFNLLEDLTSRHPESFGDELEVVDQGLHRVAHDLTNVLQGVSLPIGADGQLRGPGDLLVGDHHRSGRGIEAVDGLVDDLQRFVEFAEADDDAVEGVGLVGGGHLEIEGLVSAVGHLLAQVHGVARGADRWSGQSEGHRPGQRDVPDINVTQFVDRVGHDDVLQLTQVVTHLGHEFADHRGGVGRYVLDDAAGADVGVVHPQAGDVLQDAKDLFACPEGDGHQRGTTQLVPGGTDGHEMGGNAVEFHDQHADEVGALGNVVGDAQQFFHCQAVRRLLEQRGEVVHPGTEGHTLRPGAVLHVLLDTRVQVTGTHPHLVDRFTLDVEDQPQHAVGGGVHRAHVDDDAFFAEAFGFLRDRGPVAAFCGELCPGTRVVRRGLGGPHVLSVAGHQLYDLRTSGGGTVAPLYSTGIPPSG